MSSFYVKKNFPTAKDSCVLVDVFLCSFILYIIPCIQRWIYTTYNFCLAVVHQKMLLMLYSHFRFHGKIENVSTEQSTQKTRTESS